MEVITVKTKAMTERQKIEKALVILDLIERTRFRRKVIISNMNMLCGYMPELKAKYVDGLLFNNEVFKRLKNAYRNHIKTLK